MRKNEVFRSIVLPYTPQSQPELWDGCETTYTEKRLSAFLISVPVLHSKTSVTSQHKQRDDTQRTYILSGGAVYRFATRYKHATA